MRWEICLTEPIAGLSTAPRGVCAPNSKGNPELPKPKPVLLKTEFNKYIKIIQNMEMNPNDIILIPIPIPIIPIIPIPKLRVLLGNSKMRLRASRQTRMSCNGKENKQDMGMGRANTAANGGSSSEWVLGGRGGGTRPGSEWKHMYGTRIWRNVVGIGHNMQRIRTLKEKKCWNVRTK